MPEPTIITIDGPAGAGKSTLAKEIAKKFGYLHLDSGALYRTIGYACVQRGVDLSDEKKVLNVARSISVELQNGKVLLNGEDVTRQIRTPEAGKWASQVAQYPEVREVVVQILRKLARGKKVVVDGRDAGSYIFPEAQLKIYLTASSQERAKRRLEELKRKGFNLSYEEVLKEIVERDRKDENRPFAPLKVPEGAVIIDSTGKTLEEVLQEVEKLIKNDP
ncbi:cytidylate kinase [Thermovibrio ammonificans HB-1]|uniref:Cytidylate kinase n=1 Tax=Thermovibrio ammonificans (strain DSM 15698 / JCM 12110 / HB-1) TaxID=648996 RepID=E8T2U4_THEA1|nr:(d)CMP kinase [Thermovibrio ammonificans]ADU97153.1 cytidylate kinase [Thermovibrio ammonificans HB-1]